MSGGNDVTRLNELPFLKSKEKFAKEYGIRCGSKEKVEELYIHVLISIEKAIVSGNFDSFKKLCDFVNFISSKEDPVTLNYYFKHINNPLRGINLVILCCKHNKVKFLEYLFSSECTVLSNLHVDIGRRAILPSDEDEMHHNAFYYAIRSGSTKLFDILSSKWPDNYFGFNLQELDDCISIAYEELKLKNINLPEAMEVSVEYKLMDLRFLSDVSEEQQPEIDNLENFKKRVSLLLCNISLLLANYSNSEKVDEKFLFIAKFIVQCLHTLKGQLRPTKLPWEEIEFCLISFILSITSQQEIHLLSKCTLNKRKILKYLEHFAEEIVTVLEGPREPSMSDESINNSQFEGLLSDYQQLRDMHSLKKMSDYLNRALIADYEKREGQLVILRAMQIIGEYLKKSAEPSKLSNSISEYLLLLLSEKTHKVLIDLRNSLSHYSSLSRRMKMEETADINLYIAVKFDFKRIYNVITDIICRYKVRAVRTLLKQIADSENLFDIKEYTEILGSIEADEGYMQKFKLVEHEKLKALVKELTYKTKDMSNCEMKLLKKIDSVVDRVDQIAEEAVTSYSTGLLSLKVLGMCLKLEIADDNVLSELKKFARTVLKNTALRADSKSLNEIAELAVMVSSSVEARLGPKDGKLKKINSFLYNILSIAEFGTDDTGFTKKFLKNIGKKNLCLDVPKKRRVRVPIAEQQLAMKISQLDIILSDNQLTTKSINKVIPYKRNKMLQAKVEMLVLDILSVLDGMRNRLEENQFFLEESIPFLTGKSLCNHLLYDHDIQEVLPTNTSVSVVLNAMKLVSENVVESNLKFGKPTIDDPEKLRCSYDLKINHIIIQEEMFSMLEEGDVEDLDSYLEAGADIKARSTNLWTALHFAAKGGNLVVIKYFLKEKLDINAKDVNGQSPIHIAAAYGNSHVVEFFIKECKVHVDDMDNTGKTPLHIAATYGHKGTIKVLLNNNADFYFQDDSCFAAVHYAILHNNIDAVKLLMKKEENVDANVIASGFTCLHLAAHFGYIELVNFLIRRNANVNARNETHITPLHLAVPNGRLDITKALIFSGANVNAKVISGCSALHLAAQHGLIEIANVLLASGASVNSADIRYSLRPLHFAVMNGHEEMCKLLLANKANGNHKSVEGGTPLHFAASRGHFKIVSILVNNKVNINAKDNDQTTPLSFAAKKGHTEVVLFLIQNGAEVNIQDKSGLSPLHFASMNGHLDVAELLIEHNAAVSVRDIYERVPLHLAALNNKTDVINLLVKNGAELNAKMKGGMTPLHNAVSYGHEESAEILISHGAEANNTADYKFTMLHCAVMGSHKEMVKLLLDNGAEIEGAVGESSDSPLHLAVGEGKKEIVEMLIANGANVNASEEDVAPLPWAIINHHREVAKVLISHGANFNLNGGECIFSAMVAGFIDVVECMCEHGASLEVRNLKGETLLHEAVKRGTESAIRFLLAKGLNINMTDSSGKTPLYCAAEIGRKEAVEMLIANGASTETTDRPDSPLLIAAVNGHDRVVEVLIRNEADKEKDYNSVVQFAVSYNRLNVVKLLMKCPGVDVNARSKEGLSLLHIASQGSSLAMVKYLTEAGCDVHIVNDFLTKPIHIAAREGCQDIVEYFLSKGLSVDEIGNANQTILHYAAIKGQSKIIKFLVGQGADVNAKDIDDMTPLHVAALCGHKDVAEILLKNGAIYNIQDKFSKRPEAMAEDNEVTRILRATAKLFKSVSRNEHLEVKKDIDEGACVNAKNLDGGTPLHYAAWKGFEKCVDILLEKGANPNSANNKGATPFHYALKYFHIKIIKALLSKGAIYDVMSTYENKQISSLFATIDKAFKYIGKNSSEVLNLLNRIKDIETFKAVIGACNREGKTLTVFAMLNNFTRFKELTEVWQGDVATEMERASSFYLEGYYQDALKIYVNILTRRNEILGADHPGTLNAKTFVAKVLFKIGKHQEAIEVLEDVAKTQEEMLGANNSYTLSTRGQIALTLYAHEKYDDALNLYYDIYRRQVEELGPNHAQTLNTRFHLALVLDKLGNYDDAYAVIVEVYEEMKVILGPDNLSTILAYHNIGGVLWHQGKLDDTFTIYKEVIKVEDKISGVQKDEIFSTLFNFAGQLGEMKKHRQALELFESIWNVQNKDKGPKHPDTLRTAGNIAVSLMALGKWDDALEIYQRSIDDMKSVFGPKHECYVNSLKHIEIIRSMVMDSEDAEQLQEDVNAAAEDGNNQTTRDSDEKAAGRIVEDINGKTPLHCAVDNGNLDIVKLLLKHKANVSQATSNGYTPLHTAACNGYSEIVDVLLQNTNSSIKSSVVNAKTKSNKFTALHFASEIGFLDAVLILLKHGATYNIKNNDGKMPVDLSKDNEVINILKIVQNSFEKVGSGHVEVLDELKTLKPNEFLAVINARDDDGKTLVQVCLANGHKTIACQLLQMLKSQT